jgi:serine/threonine-protein kinase
VPAPATATAPGATAPQPVQTAGKPTATDAPAAPGGTGATPSDPSQPAPAAQTCDAFVGFDDLYTRMQQDLSRQDAGDRVFLRYISLANRLNQGACADALEFDRLALIKAINSVSTDTSIVLPQAVGSDGALLRIDLRDLGWDQPIVVDGSAFTDKWEALIAASEFAVEFEGDQADDVKLKANTLVPVLNADALIDVALKDNLYYELLGIGASEDELLEQLGIDEEAQEDQGLVIRAGTSQSRLSRQPTVAERLELEDRQGFYWSRYDLADGTAGQSIFSDPLGFQEDVILTIFSLPNGLNAYVIFDGAGVRQTDTEVVLDPGEAEMENSVSCNGCHATGLNPITDEVRDYVQANSRDFNADDFQEIQDSFLEQSEIDATLRSDIQLYQRALVRTGLDKLKIDPVEAVYERFDGDVDLAVAAGDLGLTPAELRDDLGFVSQQVDPQLSVLRSGSLLRAGFEELYLPALCALSITSDNRPAAAACAAVGQ